MLEETILNIAINTFYLGPSILGPKFVSGANAARDYACGILSGVGAC